MSPCRRCNQHPVVAAQGKPHTGFKFQCPEPCQITWYRDSTHQRAAEGWERVVRTDPGTSGSTGDGRGEGIPVVRWQESGR